MIEFIQVVLVCYVLYAVLVQPLRQPTPVRIRTTDRERRR